MSTSQAAADARHFLSSFRSLTKFAESVEELDNVEQRIAGLKGEEDAAKKATDAAKKRQADAEAAVIQAEGFRDTAIATANQAADAAKAEASRITSKALEEAKAIRAEAAELRRATEADILSMRTRLNAEKAKAEEELAATLAERNKVSKEIDALKRKFA